MNLKQFLFDHKTTKQIIAKNTFWLAAAEFLSRFFKFFLIVFAARILGATEYGKFSFALSFVTFFIVFADLGLDEILVRELSRDKNQESKFPAIFTLRLMLSVAMICLIVASSFFVTNDPTIRFAIWILALYIFFQSIKNPILGFFQARQRMEYNAINQIGEAVLVSGLGFFLLFNFPSVFALSSVYAFVAFVGFIFLSVLLKRKIYSLSSFSFKPDIWKQFLAISWPLALAGLSGAIFNQIDSITLGLYKQITQVGWYNAAYAIFGETLLPSMIIGQSFFPMLSRAFSEPKETMQKIYNFQIETSVFFAFGFLAGGIALAPKIIDFFYDPSYAPSVLALQILLAASAIMILYGPLYSILLIFNQQKKMFWVLLAGSFLNALLDILLIPVWDLYGPAFATFVTTAFIFIVFSFFASKLLHLWNRFLFAMIIVAALSGWVTYGFLSSPVISKLYVVPSFLLGGLVYLFLFLGWRFFVVRFVLRAADRVEIA